MKERSEWGLYLFILIGLSAMLINAGRKNVDLKSQLPLDVKALFDRMAHASSAVQLIDIRKNLIEEDGTEGESSAYEESHIPGAIPFPECSDSQSSSDALSQINPYIPTVIISNDGKMGLPPSCKSRFGLVQILAGGMIAWTAQQYPEDEGEYTPPPIGGGGGCL